MIPFVAAWLIAVEMLFLTRVLLRYSTVRSLFNMSQMTIALALAVGRQGVEGEVGGVDRLGGLPLELLAEGLELIEVLREGRDVTLVACGRLVCEALQAATRLHVEHTVEPLHQGSVVGGHDDGRSAFGKGAEQIEDALAEIDDRLRELQEQKNNNAGGVSALEFVEGLLRIPLLRVQQSARLDR